MKINEKNIIAYSVSRDHIDKEGYLNKKGEVNKAFQRRWFVLKGNLLFYFEKKGDKEPLGVIILEGCTIDLAESDEYYVFKLIFPGPNSRVYELSAESQEDLENWMKCICKASYDFLKSMVLDLQKQLEEIEESEKSSSCIRSVIPPVSICGLPNTFSKRENPFNRNEEISYTELWRCNEALENATALLSKSSSPTGGAGLIGVNPSLPPCIPFRPAPPPPIVRPPSSKNLYTQRKTFLILHKEYGERILNDRLNYTPIILKSGYSSLSLATSSDNEDFNNFSNVENLIDL